MPYFDIISVLGKESWIALSSWGLGHRLNYPESFPADARFSFFFITSVPTIYPVQVSFQRVLGFCYTG
jgi:hypothetical protein